MKLSQTMIVKNEEKNIERALSWGKGIVSEQIVVDTGSTDGTVELAEKMGAKVYHFEWINDFSAAKNYAIEKCSGDWIAFLDADEYFMEDAERIPDVIKKAEEKGNSVIAAQLLNLNDAGKIIGSMTQARFFKNNEGIRYHGRVHENLSCDHQVKIYDATKELSIFHTGYSESSHADKKKDEAYKLMLKKEIDESPDNADNYGYLGDIYAGEQNYEKAEALYLKAMDLMDTSSSDESGRRGNTLRNLLIILGGYNYRSDELLRVYDFARRILPHDADFSCMVADHFYRYQHYPEAASYYRESLDLYDEFGAYLKSDYVDSHLLEIHIKLANAYYRGKDYDSAIKTALLVLKIDKFNTETIRIMLLSVRDADMAGMSGYGIAEELVLLKKIYDFDNIKDKAFIYVLGMRLGLKELSGQIKDTCSEAEKKILENF
ncbi:glycosyl transferase [Lachnospiraceae bacterium JC7]|nr:glycosyl transferase [Lachnospiraceae bacterium JC7]